MDKRRFLKAIGMSSVASLLAAPFFARSAASSTLAQEGSSLEGQLAHLREKFEREIRDLEAAVNELSNSFIGSVVAIPYESLDEIPPDWHLCDGEEFGDGEYPLLRAKGMTSFPDYRGVFLRGLNDKRRIVDDKGEPKSVDPEDEREIGSFQDCANKKHTHGETGEAGGHTHGGYTENDGDHSHGDPESGSVGGLKVCKFSRVLEKKQTLFPEKKRTLSINITAHSIEKVLKEKGLSVGDSFNSHSPDIAHEYEIDGGSHKHKINEDGAHTHKIPENEDGADESRPKNVAVRYIIKCGPRYSEKKE